MWLWLLLQLEEKKCKKVFHMGKMCLILLSLSRTCSQWKVIKFTKQYEERKEVGFQKLGRFIFVWKLLEMIVFFFFFT
ncbi:MAG: hypothetical protein CL932_17540 [Deltaproteobacteria bacterium]|nr:hypothetical protein [Deltaproteobacteria bacterium]